MTIQYGERREGTRHAKEIIGEEVLANLEELYAEYNGNKTPETFEALQRELEPSMRKCLADDRARTMADWDFDGYFDEDGNPPIKEAK